MSLGSGLTPTWTKRRRRSFAEVRVRARQWVAAWSERVGISNQIRVPDDGTFAQLLSTEWASATSSALEGFRARTTPRFFAPFSERADVVAALRSRWPQLEGHVIAAADRIRHGEFDLLGRRVDVGAPIDWHREPVSGTRAGGRHWSRIDFLNPQVAGEYKLTWELNRHQYFTTLGKAYWYTGDERYAATFVEHLMAWMDANPPKLGINWASSLEAAFRVISWIWGLYFFKTSPCLTDAAFLRTLKFLYLHGRHVETYLSTYSSPNTHLTGEALGLLYLGTMFPEFNCAERWRRVGWEILVKQLDKHVRPDGSYFEQSTYYHRYTTDFCLHVSVLGQLNGLPVDAAFHGKLRALLDHLMYITQPDGCTSLVGDDDGGRVLTLDDRAPNDFRAALATGAVLFQRPDYRYVAGTAAEETVWLLGCGGLRGFDALDPAPPAVMSRSFPDGGYYVLRDSWKRDASTMLIDCGPHGVLNCGHAHADALGFTLVVRGRAVLVDPGTNTYTCPGAARDYFRSSAAHNTVTVAGQSSSIPSGPFSWEHIAHSSLTAWSSAARCDYFEGIHDGFARLTPPAVHSRAVLFLKGDYWIIRDCVRTDGNHDVDVHMHFAPGIAIDVLPPNRIVAQWGPDSDPERIEIGIFGHQGLVRSAETGVSVSYGALSASWSCAFAAPGKGSRELLSFLVPRSGREKSLDVSERPATNGRAFTIVGRGVEDTLLIGGGGEAASQELAGDAAWSWVRRSRGSELPTEFVMLQGRYLAWRGRPLVRSDTPMPYVAARLQGSELHVEVDAGGACTVDLLGADRLVVHGPSTAAVVGSRVSPSSEAPGRRRGTSFSVEVG